MAKIEVDEAEYAASQSLVKLFADTLNNSAARPLLLKAKKLVRPNEPIPEIDAKEEGLKEVEKLSKEFSDFRAALEKKDADADAARKTAEFQSTWDKQKSSLKSDGWLDDGIANIEKLANERGIPDLEAAAALYKKLHPEPEPIQPSGYGRWNAFELPNGDDNNTFMKKLIETRGDADGVLDGEIRAAINDVRGATVRR